MRRFPVWAFAFAGVACSGIAATIPAAIPDVPPEGAPLYQGHPAGAWLERFGSADPAVRQEAVAALAAFAEYDPAIAGGALARGLADPDPFVRRLAAEGLGSLGPRAAPATAALVQGFRDSDGAVRARCAGALAGAGPAAVPALAGVLRDPGSAPAVLEAAAAALGQMGTGAKEASDLLDGLLRHPSPGVRLAAATALPRVAADHPGAERVLPILIGALKDEGTMLAALEGLRPLGARARAAIPGLVGLLDYPIRQGPDERGGPPPAREVAAGRAAEILAACGAEAIPALIEAARAGTRDQRVRALEALARIGPPAAPAAPVLAGFLADPDDRIAFAAAAALEAAVPGRAEGVEAGVLWKMVSSRRWAVAAWAGRALADREGAAALDRLLGIETNTPGGFLTGPDHALHRICERDPDGVRRKLVALRGEAFRAERIRTLWRFDGTGQEAIPLLANLLDEPDADVRAWAIGKLTGFGQASAPAEPALIRVLSAGDPLERARAASLLGWIRGPKGAEDLVQRLVEQYRAEPPGIPAETFFDCLGRLGASARPALPLMLKALGHPHLGIRYRALSAIRALGPAAEPAIPALLRCLDDENSSVRYAAIQALGAVGSAAEGAIPALAAKAQGESDSERAAALEALGEIGRRPERVLPILRDSLAGRRKSPYGYPREALRAVRGFGPDAAPLVPAVIPWIKRRAPAPTFSDGSESAGIDAALAIAAIGPKAKEAVPALIPLLRGSRFEMAAALEAIQAIGPEAGAAAELLRRMLGEPYAWNPPAVMRALASVSPPGESVPAILRAWVGHFEECAAIVAGMGKAAIPPIVEEMQKPWGGAGCLVSFEVLARFGPEARPAVPALRRFLCELSNGKLREAAHRALLRIDPGAVPEFMRARSDGPP